MTPRLQQHNRSSFPIPLPETQYEQMPESYLRTFVDSYSAGVAVLSESGTILYVNKAWQKFLNEVGYYPDTFEVGVNSLDGPARSDVLAHESEIIAEGVRRITQRRETEFHRDYQTGESKDSRWIRIRAGRFDWAQACRILVTREDITEAHKQIESRQEEAERVQLLLDVTHIFPWEARLPDFTFTYVGEQAVELFGYPVEEWYQPGFWFSHVHPEDRERALANRIKYLNRVENHMLDYRMIAQDGRDIWLQTIAYVTRDGQHPTSISGLAIDVTNNRHNDETLRELSRRLINAQEEERRRVARELHDDLNQRMAILSIELAQLRQISEPEDWNTRLEALESQAQEISADIHRISYRLHPSKLDHLGLNAALKSLCEEVSAKNQLKVKFEQKGFNTKLSKDVTLCGFRIVQEALRNCVKHSRATETRVVLEDIGEAIRLSVSDNGCGFDMRIDALKRGLGFTSMRERLQALGGTIKIHSAPMQGTVIEVLVPLARGAESTPL